MTRRYTVIAKVGIGNEHYKWRQVTNLLRFTSFLDNKYPNWKYFNVYCSKSKEEIARFTCKDKPNRPLL